MDPLTLLVFTAAGMTVLALLRGVASMVDGGEWELRHSHELMFRRVAWQGVAVALLLLALLAES